jgi:hypothetical protein
MNSTINLGILSTTLCAYILSAHAEDTLMPIITSDKLDNYLFENRLLPESSQLNSVFPLKVSINGAEGWLVLWDVVEHSSMQDKRHRVGLFAASENTADRGNGLVLSSLSTISIEEPNRFARLIGQFKSLNKSNPTTFFLSIYSTLSGSGALTLATDLIIHLDTETWAPSITKDFGITGQYRRLNIGNDERQNTSFAFDENSANDVTLIKRSKDDDHTNEQCFRVSAKFVTNLDCLAVRSNRSFMALARPFDEFLRLSIGPGK